ncbi:MAG: hypothetical protein ACOYLD_15855, partial [Anaerohalosphaeraceae bacterium]
MIQVEVGSGGTAPLVGRGRENPSGAVYRESSVPEEKWDKWVKAGIIGQVEEKKPAAGEESGATDVRS